MLLFFSCSGNVKNQNVDVEPKIKTNAIIIDCNYTFEQAIEGTKAPKYLIDQLELITVHYYSMDGKMHQGQLLANKAIVADLRVVFKEILQLKFPIAKVIPIVKYNWSDEASMNDNNTYSFCYRNASYSKHAYGLAVDINPRQNPNRWKSAFSYRENKPLGAIYNVSAPGTFTPTNPIVILFAEKGFMWGRNFTRNYDDHHFEKKLFN